MSNHCTVSRRLLTLAAVVFQLSIAEVSAAERSVVVPPSFGGMVTDQIGSGVQSMFAARAAGAEASAKIADAREDYWSRFPDGDGLEEAGRVFAKLLFDKDFATLPIHLDLTTALPAQYQNGPKPADMIPKLVGSIDHGIRPRAEAAFQRWVGRFKSNLLGEENSLVNAMSGERWARAYTESWDAYQAYVRQRDLAEFAAAVHRLPFQNPKDYVIALHRIMLGTLDDDSGRSERMYVELVELFGEDAVLAAAAKVRAAPKDRNGDLSTTMGLGPWSGPEPYEALCGALSSLNTRGYLLGMFGFARSPTEANAKVESMMKEHGKELLLEAADRLRQVPHTLGQYPTRVELVRESPEFAALDRQYHLQWNSVPEKALLRLLQPPLRTFNVPDDLDDVLANDHVIVRGLVEDVVKGPASAGGIALIKFKDVAVDKFCVVTPARADQALIEQVRSSVLGNRVAITGEIKAGRLHFEHTSLIEIIERNALKLPWDPAHPIDGYWYVPTTHAALVVHHDEAFAFDPKAEGDRGLLLMRFSHSGFGEITAAHPLAKKSSFRSAKDERVGAAMLSVEGTLSANRNNLTLRTGSRVTSLQRYSENESPGPIDPQAPLFAIDSISAPNPSGLAEERTYVVQQGDTWETVERRFRMSRLEIIAFMRKESGHAPRGLRPGDTIKLPPPPDATISKEGAPLEPTLPAWVDSRNPAYSAWTGATPGETARYNYTHGVRQVREHGIIDHTFASMDENSATFDSMVYNVIGGSYREKKYAGHKHTIVRVGYNTSRSQIGADLAPELQAQGTPETITVGGTEYECIRYETVFQDAKGSYTTVVWVNRNVPGRIVRYEQDLRGNEKFIMALNGVYGPGEAPAVETLQPPEPLTEIATTPIRPVTPEPKPARPPSRPEEEPTPLVDDEGTYIIQASDRSLASICLRFQVTPDAMRQANSEVDFASLRPGTRISIPEQTGPLPTHYIYEAVDGDTLAWIARRYRVTEDDITTTNPQLSNRTIAEGDVVVIFTDNAPVPEIALHRVYRVDTLETIAQNYDVTADDIRAANPGINPESLNRSGTIFVTSMEDTTSLDRVYRPRPRRDTFRTVAAAFSLTEDELAAANPGREVDLRTRVTELLIPWKGPRPPSEPVTRRPTRSGRRAAATAPAEQELNADGTYTTARGDTWSSVCERFGITREQLYTANPTLRRSGYLQKGITLVIPKSR